MSDLTPLREYMNNELEQALFILAAEIAIKSGESRDLCKEALAVVTKYAEKGWDAMCVEKRIGPFHYFVAAMYGSKHITSMFKTQHKLTTNKAIMQLHNMLVDKLGTEDVSVLWWKEIEDSGE